MRDRLKMVKSHLVTRETMRQYYKEEMGIPNIVHMSPINQSHFKESAGDDLELFFKDLQNGKFKHRSLTFFLPKILECERKMIEERRFHLRDHYLRSHENLAMETADVSKVEMDLSESNSKFIVYYCHRRTYRLPEISGPETRNQNEYSWYDGFIQENSMNIQEFHSKYFTDDVVNFF